MSELIRLEQTLEEQELLSALLSASDASDAAELEYSRCWDALFKYRKEQDNLKKMKTSTITKDLETWKERYARS